MTVEVPLTRGLVAIIDDSDAAMVLSYAPWAAGKTPASRNWYARKTVQRGDTQTSIYMHRLILPGVTRVDHVNGDGLDNRRGNLRPASHAGNMRNARRRSDNTSGYKGVTWDKRRQLWAASVHVDKKHVHVGHFGDLGEAARAYDAAALHHFGEFARLNFPQETAA